MRVFDVDAAAGTVSFEASAFYSRQSLGLAALVFETRADVSAASGRKSFKLTLKSKAKRTTGAALEALAGEFLNELLNQEYRRVIVDFNAKISDVIVTQTLYCAGGGRKDAKPRSGESSPRFDAAVERLMRDARAEIEATMPRKIPRP